MTENAIVMKLNALLADPIDSEVKAVYLMAEVRKLLERTSDAQPPFALNMYCHWALHIDLNSPGTIRSFFQQVDDYVHSHLIGPEDFLANTRMVGEFLALETLRSQLRDFCQSKRIRTDLVDDETRWYEFVKHYAGVIDDGSLSIRAANHGMKYVKSVTFTRGRNSMGEFTQLPFEMTWRVALLHKWKGYHSLTIDASARPPKGEVAQMVGSGITLEA